jgi:hypothetical protein
VCGNSAKEKVNEAVDKVLMKLFVLLATIIPFVYQPSKEWLQ